MSRHLPPSHIKNLCSMFSKRFMWISAFRHRRQTDFANTFLFRYLLLCICVFAVPRQTRLLFCRRTIWDKVSSSCQNPTHRGTFWPVARRETRNLTPQMALSAYFWILIEPAKLTSPPDSTHSVFHLMQLWIGMALSSAWSGLPHQLSLHGNTKTGPRFAHSPLIEETT